MLTMRNLNLISVQSWTYLVVKGSGVVIRRSRVQGVHPATGGISFSVVPSSNPWSHFVNRQQVCLLLVGIFNYRIFNC